MADTQNGTMLMANNTASAAPISGNSNGGEIAKTAVSSPTTPAPEAAKSKGQYQGNASLIGGALDSLGLTVTGWYDRMQYKKAQEQEQKNFDKQFEENVRRFGLEFALREWATRKGVDMEEAQMRYNQSMGSRQLDMQVENQMFQRQVNKMGLDDMKRKRAAALSFVRGFSAAQRGKQWQPKTV